MQVKEDAVVCETLRFPFTLCVVASGRPHTPRYTVPLKSVVNANLAKLIMGVFGVIAVFSDQRIFQRWFVQFLYKHADGYLFVTIGDHMFVTSDWVFKYHLSFYNPRSQCLYSIYILQLRSDLNCIYHHISIVVVIMLSQCRFSVSIGLDNSIFLFRTFLAFTSFIREFLRETRGILQDTSSTQLLGSREVPHDIFQRAEKPNGKVNTVHHHWIKGFN